MEKWIKITSTDCRALRTHLLRGAHEDEEAAVLLAGISQTDGRVTLLVKDVIPVPNEALVVKSRYGLTIDPDFLAGVIKRCRQEGLSFILTHSHPFSADQVRFSPIDDQGEAALFPRIQARVPGVPHATIVFGQNTLAARIWLPGRSRSEPVDVVSVIGDQVEHIAANPDAQRGPATTVVGTHARQILALGSVGQQRLQRLKVGIVGLGGVGSQVHQQLVHLGVHGIVRVDDDLVEQSNLSRLVGAANTDIAQAKVMVAERLAQSINPGLAGTSIQESVLHLDVAMRLRDADVLFACTDNLRSRVLLNRLARQYLIPLVDVGVDIQPDVDSPEVIRAIGGRVMVIYPDGPCLACLGILNPEALAMEDAREGRSPGYIMGQKVPAPSVISFNGVVASLAVSEFLNLATGYARRTQRSYLVYDGLRGAVRPVAMTADCCGVCPDIKAAGDLLRLPGIQAGTENAG